MHIHTHYDNLQLTQNATDADIRQAYRRLSKKYHPDLCDDPDAHRIMQLVNRAYEVLSNPQTRAEHDKWIAMQYLRHQQVQVVQATAPIAYYTTENDDEDDVETQDTQKRILKWLMWISVVLFGLLLWQGFQWAQRHRLLPNVLQDNLPAVIVNLPAESPAAPEHCTRPEAAPNGSLFPQESNYIEGYPIISGMGRGKLIIENVRNSSDVFAQLYEKNSPQPLRTFFVVEREQMTLDSLDAGEYFVRYYQLDDGESLNTESITLARNQSATIYLQRGKAPQF